MTELTDRPDLTIAAGDRAAVAAWIGLPILTFILLFFGMGRTPPCLGGWLASACPVAVEPGVFGLVATPEEALWTVVAFSLGWLLSGAWLLRALRRVGHPVVHEVVRTTLVAGILFGLTGLLHGVVVGGRLRSGAEEAILLGVLGVLLAWETRLLWLVTRRRSCP